jgi:hypothetical protein
MTKPGALFVMQARYQQTRRPCVPSAALAQLSKIASNALCVLQEHMLQLLLPLVSPVNSESTAQQMDSPSASPALQALQPHRPASRLVANVSPGSIQPCPHVLFVLVDTSPLVELLPVPNVPSARSQMPTKLVALLVLLVRTQMTRTQLVCLVLLGATAGSLVSVNAQIALQAGYQLAQASPRVSNASQASTVRRMLLLVSRAQVASIPVLGSIGASLVASVLIQPTV